MHRLQRSLIGLLVLVAATAHARVISYAPYTNRFATPAVQHRMNRYFVLFEAGGIQPTGVGMPMPPIACCYSVGQIVLYDTKGESEPRVIFPTDGVSTAGFSAVAVRENGGVPTILIQTAPSMNPATEPTWMLSTDGGTTWKKVPLPAMIL